MTYAYIRVSTKKQSYERQFQNITKAYPGEDIKYFTEKESGKNNERPEFLKLLKKLKPGDKVIFDSVSRMSRDAEEGSRIYFELVDMGVELFFINEPYINSEVYIENCKDRLELTGSDEDEIFKGINAYFKKLAAKQIRIAFDQAEKEGHDISTRISAGMDASGAKGTLKDKADGKIKEVGKISKARTGKTYETTKSKNIKEKLLKMSKSFDGNMTDKEILDVLDVSRNSLYKYKAQLREEMEK